MSARSVVVRLSAEASKYIAEISNAKQATDQLGQAQDKAGQASQKMTQEQKQAAAAAAEAAQKQADAWSTVGTAATVAGAATLVGVGLAVNAYADFDKQMSSVQAATHATAGDMDLLREAAINAGADTAYSAVEAAQGIEELAKAGVSTKDILAGGLTGALSLAAAGALSVGEAAEIAASAMTQFKLTGADIPHIADLLAAGAGKAQGSVHDMGMALNQVGLVASATGLTIDETVGSLAALASAGLTGSDAGTSLKATLQRLVPTSKEAQRTMEELGISAYDANGAFIGMSEFAGVLQNSLKGASDEQYAMAMNTIFGADAVRAANVLFNEGAEGIEKWENAVADAGYAAETAALMQDNLAGDLEKLGGAFDTLLIKSGSGVSEVLRGLVQGLEGLVDAAGRVPGPILQVGLGVTALVGGALLLGGGLITVIPKIAATKDALNTLAPAGSKAASALGKVGKVVGLAAVAFAVLEIGKAVHNNLQPATATAEDFTQTLIKLKNSATAVDEAFAAIDPGSGGALLKDVTDVGTALQALDASGPTAALGRFGSEVLGVNNDVTKLKDTFGAMDSALSASVQSGNLEQAAAGFKAAADSAKLQGVALERVGEAFPEYISSLQDVASAAGVSVGEQDLLNWAMGQTPQAMLDAAAASEETAAALGGVAAGAQEAVVPLEDLIEALFALGLISMDSRESTAAFHEALREMTAVQAAAADGSLGLGAVLNATATDFDLTTEAGSKANAAFQNIAVAGMNDVESKARAGMGQPELQANLQNTYNELINAARGMGIEGAAADTLARQVMGIPDQADTNAYFHDAAAKLAISQLDQQLNAIDGKTVNTYAHHHMTETLTKIRTGDTSEPAPKAPGWGVRAGGVATGGRISDIPGYAAGGQPGGRIKYPAPADMRLDNVLGLVNGKPIALQGQEWIVNGINSSKYDKELAAINAGTFPTGTLDAPAASAFGREVAAPAAATAYGAMAQRDLQLTGNLYLDSGEFLGKVRGIAREESSSVVDRIDGTITRLGRGGKYSGRK